MKTLLVLSALVAVAIAAPAQPEAALESHPTKSSPDVSPSTGKTASPESFNNEVLHKVGNVSPLQLDESHEPSARLHFGLKKPIIIKKKFGSSHLYRNSDEEQAQADSQENCMKEVKVKLCDAEKMSKTDKARSIITEDADTHTLDSEVEHSIKMAKEAVENLQRGLLNMEHKSDAKMSQWKHSNLESDVEMHEDIEVARQALDHIQKNFGNLESMNLRAATLKDMDNQHDSPKKISESDEARLDQWKEAIDIIQRNVEIAKNIEDSFKSADHDTDSCKSKSMINMNNVDKQSELHESAMKSTEEKAALLHKDEEFNKHGSDMTVSASSPVEVKINPETTINPLEKKVTSKSTEFGKSSVTEDKLVTDETITKEKSTESDGELANKNIISVLKSAEKTEKLLGSEDLESSAKAEKLIDTEPPKSTTVMISTDKFEQKLEHTAAKNSEIEQEKSASKEQVEKTLLAQPADHGKSENSDATLLKKEVIDTLNSAETLRSIQEVQQFSNGKSAEDLKITEHPDSIATMKSADHVVQINEIEATDLPVPPMGKSAHLDNNMQPSTHMAINAADFPFPPMGKSANLESNNHPSAHMNTKAADFPFPPMGMSAHLDSNMQPSTHIEMKAADFPVPPIGKLANLDSNKQPSAHTIMKAADFPSLPMGMPAHMDSNMQPSTHVEMKAADFPVPPMEKLANLDSNKQPSAHMNMKAADFPSPPMGMSAHFDSNMQPSTHVEMKASDFSVAPLGRLANLDSNKQPSANMNMKAADFPFSSMGKSVPLDSNMQWEMKAAEEKSAMAQWKKIHEARGAYGLGGYGTGAGSAGAGLGGYGGGAGSSGAGAVGVFPNAKVGGCAIPLLLSCSPSVVSGSLAKSHSSGYGAPAYRMGEDLKYHFKRDTKKTNEIPSNKVKRTNTKRVEKISLEKKL